MIDEYIFKFFAFCLGGIIGSFLNAYIYRAPRGISIVKQSRSKCPGCDKVISWYENIPIISFLYLRGKCSACEFKIPVRYVFIELLMGVVFLLLLPWPMTSENLVQFLFYGVVAASFCAHFFIDLDAQILPDGNNLLLAILFLIFGIQNIGTFQSLLGGALGLLIPLSVTWVFYKIKGQVGLGGGDIKLFAALGLYLGPAGFFQNLFLSCFLGSIIGIVAIALFKHAKDKPMPFGPSILLVSTFQIFFPTYFQQLIKKIFL